MGVFIDKEVKHKTRMLGTIRYVGALLARRMLASKVSGPVKKGASGTPGVTWNVHANKWHARVWATGDGKRKSLNKYVRPVNETPEEIERARLIAVEELGKLRRLSR